MTPGVRAAVLLWIVLALACWLLVTYSLIYETF